MWTLITGQIISNISESLLIQLYADNLSNKNISIIGITVGWLFYEHVPEDFQMTGGKRFMLNWDFRYRFLTQTILVGRNLILLVQTITTLELGTFLILLSLLFYLIWVHLNNEENLKYLFQELLILLLLLIVLHKKLQMYLTFFGLICFLFFTTWLRVKKKMAIVLRDTFVFLYFLVLLKQGLHIYWMLDILFVTQPFIFIFFTLFFYFCIACVSYFIYLTINRQLKTLSLTIKIFIIKSFIYLFNTIFIVEIIIIFLHVEIMTCQNFFQELIIKIILFNCFITN